MGTRANPKMTSRRAVSAEGVHSPPLDLTGPGTGLSACAASASSTNPGLCDGVEDEAQCTSQPGCLWSTGEAEPLERGGVVPSCLTFGPRRWMSFGTRSIGEARTMSFEVRNECEEPVTFQLSKRGVEPSFVLDANAVDEPVTVNPGSTTLVSVDFSPDRVGSFEEVIAVEFLSPDIGHWAISLWGDGVP